MNNVMNPMNVFGKGLMMAHLQNIVVSSQARGQYCCLFHNTTLGIKLGYKDHGKCPQIGDGVTICAGAGIFDDVHIANGITIGAYAVVTKTCDEENIVLGGIPAKVISKKIDFPCLSLKIAYIIKMEEKMRRVIITGATGAVGTALIRELISNNIEVLVFCREGSSRNQNIPKHPFVELKYCSLDQLASVENDTGKIYDVFYHFAWDGTTGAARNDMYLQNENVRYALEAVGVASRFGCKKFIGAGSQAEYGRVEGVLKPDTPAFPEMGYGIAKLCAGQMTREYAHQLGMEHNWVRILSVYGPNDRAQSMVMSTINKLKNNEVPQFTKGEQMWDYLFSYDAAMAFRLVGEKGIDGKVYVLGSGESRPLAEYIEDIRSVVNPKGIIELGAVPYTSKQVMFLKADITELQKDTGFSPSTRFKIGINTTAKWRMK